MDNHPASKSLNYIRNLKGLDELKQLVEEWYIVARNLNKLPKRVHVTLPNCLFAARSGTGITMLLGLISEFLEQNNLVEFTGDVKYFEFVLNRSDNPESFHSFSRLIENTHIAAGFRGIFKGIACIDISEWVDALHDIRFMRFLEYASDSSSNILFIFVIPLLEDKKIQEVEAVLASYLRIRRTKLDFPESHELFEYVLERLHEYGFSLQKPARSALEDAINHVRGLESFDGYNTLNNLVDEIIYEKCSHAVLNDNIVTIEDLHLFLPEGPWVKQLCTNRTIRAKLGFN